MMIQSYLRAKAISMLLENFSISEAAMIFSVDYRNLCAYVKGRKEMPLTLCFDIFNYLDAKVVVFRSKLNL